MSRLRLGSRANLRLFIVLAVLLVPLRVVAGRADSDPGALILVTLSSRVGVLLDEIPLLLRDRAAEVLLRKDTDFWLTHARWQIEHTLHRLISRHAYNTTKFQLPLPPAEKWSIKPGKPERT